MGRHIVWSETRQAVRDAIGALASGEPSVASIVGSLDPLGREMDAAPHATVGALGEFVERGNFRERTVAALFVLKIAQWHAPLVRKQLADRARAQLMDALASKTDEDRLFACLSFTMGYVPTECIPALFELMHDTRGLQRDDLDAITGAIPYAAAAALSTVDPNETHSLAQRDTVQGARTRGYEFSFSDVVQTLKAGMASGKNNATRGLCASAFVRLLPDSEEIVRQAIEVLSAVEAELKYGILIAFKQVGERSVRIEDALLGLASDEAAPGVIRGCAAETLGVLTQGSDRVLPVLLSALTSDDPLLVRGAMLGIRHAGINSMDAVRQYISLLSADREDIRISAMNGLAAIRPMPHVAVQALVDRIGLEFDRGATRTLIEALASAESAAVPQLVDTIKTKNVHGVIVALQVLASIGIEGARALLEASRLDAGAEILEALGEVVRQLGPTAAPLVPDFAEEIETSSDGQRLAVCVACIYWTQSSDPVAARTLVAALLYAQDEVAIYAERALRVIGAASVPALQEALAENKGERLERLSHLLEELSRPAVPRGPEVERSGARSAAIDPRFAHIRAFGKDRPLMTFVYVARIWAEHGPLSLRKITAILEEQERKGTSTPGHKLKAKTIADHLDAVRAHWTEETLTTGENRRAGGLTESGRMLLGDIEAYFESKYGHPLE